jgi:hypothetical protein
MPRIDHDIDTLPPQFKGYCCDRMQILPAPQCLAGSVPPPHYGVGIMSSPSPLDREVKEQPTCTQMQAVHDSSLAAHMDAYTGGKYTGQGISQEQVKDMMHSSAFSAHEKAELKAINLMIPDAAELFKVQDVNKATLGAYIGWSCKE